MAFLLALSLVVACFASKKMSTQQNVTPFFPGPVVRYCLAPLGLVACLMGAWFSGRIGVARLLGVYGVLSNVLPAVNEAVQLSPLDSEGYLARAQAIKNTGQLQAALPDYERATALQPNNFARWSELGGVYDLAGKPDEAIAAVQRAIRIAPYYAQPRWQLGNLLLRKGQRQAAFAEFRQAVNSDPALVPNAVELAWGAFAGKAQAVEQVLQPETALARLELAHVFAARGAVDDAMRVFRAVADTSESTSAVREKLRTELFQAKHYYEAWEVWAVGRNLGANAANRGRGAITDGGFEKQISMTETGFGWRVSPEKPTVSVVMDAQNPFAETTSLQIRWDGKSSSSVYTAWQLVLIEPNKHYRLSFAARTKELVSGGLPEVVVLSDFEGQVLAAADLPQGTNSWQNYTLEFTAPATKEVVYLVIRRKSCPVLSCPAFGTAWFDAFSIKANN